MTKVLNIVNPRLEEIFLIISLLFFFGLDQAWADGNQQVSVPKEIKALVGASDTLLAYKTLEMPVNEGPLSVIIVRHKLPSTGTFGFDQNPCDLIILGKKDRASSIQAGNSKIVDCTYNIFAKNIAKLPDDLNEFLKFSAQEISYNNKKDKGGETYTFRYSLNKKVWYLYSANVTYVRNNKKSDRVDVVQENIQYPKDMSFISLADFDPKNLTKILSKNSKVVK